MWPEKSVRRQLGNHCLCLPREPQLYSSAFCFVLFFCLFRNKVSPPAFLILGNRILTCGLDCRRVCSDPPASTYQPGLQVCHCIWPHFVTCHNCEVSIPCSQRNQQRGQRGRGREGGRAMQSRPELRPQAVGWAGEV